MSEYIVTKDGELKHYGVVGMKWGIRRARRKDAKSTYKKATDKAFKEYESSIADIEKSYKRGQKLSKKDLDREQAAEKKYSEATAKAKSDYKRNLKSKENDAAIANRLYSKQSKQANDAVANMSTGKAIGQSMLLGSYGALKYNEARARGAGKGRAAVEGLLYNSANDKTSGVLSAAQYVDNRQARKRK